MPQQDEINNSVSDYCGENKEGLISCFCLLKIKFPSLFN